MAWHCTARQLAVGAGRQEGAAGRRYRVVVFTDTGDRTCRLPRGTGTCPPDYAALSVAPPRQSAATRLAVPLPACGGLSVRPVVAGVTGE